MASQAIKSALESLLFVWGEPLEAKTAAELFNMSVPDTVDAFRELKKEYEERKGGIILREIDKSFQLATNPENDDYIQKLCTPVQEKRLSQQALEVLAIIAYKQPVTKGEIDAIRGIRSDRVVEGLLHKDLIREKGRATTIGRPILYATTRNFLDLFGFESLADLPELGDIGDILPDEPEGDESIIGQLSMLDTLNEEEAAPAAPNEEQSL